MVSHLIRMLSTCAVVGASLGVLSGSRAEAADRLLDKDVKQLIEQIKSARDRFDDELDDNAKHSRFRSPNGEVDVHQFLEDFGDQIDRLKDRFKDDYSASTEARVVLQQATSIDRFVHSQPPGTKGESEWTRLADHLKALAATYGTTFPLPTDAPVRRLNDKEVETAADGLERGAEQLGKAIESAMKNDKSFDPVAGKSLVTQADQLSHGAKALREQLSDEKPSSAEAQRVLQQIAQLRAAVEGRALPSPIVNAWSALGSNIRIVSQGYGAGVP